jgi:hypothetical protein
MSDITLNASSASLIAESRLRYLAAQIHSLGERPLFELFRELTGGVDLAEALERYARIAPFSDFIQALDIDCLDPPRVAGGRQ